MEASGLGVHLNTCAYNTYTCTHTYTHPHMHMHEHTNTPHTGTCMHMYINPIFSWSLAKRGLRVSLGIYPSHFSA